MRRLDYLTAAVGKMQPLLLATSLLATGCSTTSSLSFKKPDSLAIPNRVNIRSLPVGIEVRASDRFPVSRTGLDATISSYSPGSSTTTYPLKTITEAVFRDAVVSNFKLPKPGKIPALRIDILVQRSVLIIRKSRAEYELDVVASLVDKFGRRPIERSLSGRASSLFDGFTVPNAVWEGNRQICDQFLAAIANNTEVMALLKTYEEVVVGSTYECDLRVIDLRAVRVVGESGTTDSPQGFRRLAEDMVARLAKKWSSRGVPKVAVLEFTTTGAPPGAGLGDALAMHVETALERQGFCRIIDRKRIGEILQEHDLLMSDVVRNPALLHNAGLKIENVEFFVTGHIAVLQAD
ncbi:hypothetical protein ACFLSJ_06730 [Verrucomicrobiota bacterium]